MNLDFRKLSKSQQVEAIEEVLRQDNYGPAYLAHLIASGSYDVYGWFNFGGTLKGADYWIELRWELSGKYN